MKRIEVIHYFLNLITKKKFINEGGPEGFRCIFTTKRGLVYLLQKLDKPSSNAALRFYLID